MEKEHRLRKILGSTIVAAVVLAGGLSHAAPQRSATASDEGPTPGGLATDNVEWVGMVPGVVDGVGGRFVGKFFYVNDQQKVMILDASNPESPQMTDFYPLPQEWELGREDLDTNGEILIAPNLGHLHILNVEDKSNIQLITELTNAGDHTNSCILDCTWSYGSEGTIIDLRDPAEPKLLDEQWYDALPAKASHDVNEVAPGIVLTSSQPLMLLDVRKDPVHPKLLAIGPTHRTS